MGRVGDLLMHTAVHSDSINLVKLILTKNWDGWTVANCDGVTAIEMALRMENESNAISEAMIGEMRRSDLEALGERMLEICKSIVLLNNYILI